MSGPMKPMFPPAEPPLPERPIENNFQTFEMPLDDFGAPGFTLNERVDFSGHNSGRVDPHANVDLLNDNGPLDFYKPKVGDLCNTQLPGFNGMQDLFKK